MYLNANKKITFLMLSMAVTSVSFIGVTALSVYAWGVYGAVLSVVGSNFTIQLLRRIYAVRLGCPIRYEKPFLAGLVLFISVYVAVLCIEMNYIAKGLMAVFILSVVIINFRDELACQLRNFFSPNPV